MIGDKIPFSLSRLGGGATSTGQYRNCTSSAQYYYGIYKPEYFSFWFVFQHGGKCAILDICRSGTRFVFETRLTDEPYCKGLICVIGISNSYVLFRL